MWLQPVELESENVKLVPLTHQHADDLARVSEEGNLSDVWYTSVPNSENIQGYIASALKKQDLGTSLPFAVIDKNSQKVVGTTRFYDASPKNRRLLLGYTFYAKSAQRSYVNTETKLLLLQHAFETLDAIAVEFRTHWHNLASRNAIARLGAKQDGVLRHHMIMPDGSLRDTVVFSILDNEWPAVKSNLNYKLAVYS